jgi:nitroreductase
MSETKFFQHDQKVSLSYRMKNLFRPAAFKVRRLIFLMNLFIDHANDAWKYFKWSHNGIRDRKKAQMESAIVKAYHGFEKGLSLRSPKPGFGQEKAKNLLKKLSEWHSRYDPTEMTKAAECSLLAYRDFNKDLGISLSFMDTWADRIDKTCATRLGGTLTIRKDDILKHVDGVSKTFFTSRHSMRNFSAEEIPMRDIERAVLIAQKSPSVCNRQGVRVLCAKNAEEALKWQPGNKGFGHLASRGLVITADLQAFSSSGERNQAYVDGGLFAMSLVYALHSMGYGSCMLAWNKSARDEKEVRQSLKIKDNEVIIMMIAAGTLPDEFEVACSHRRPISEVLTVY